MWITRFSRNVLKRAVAAALLVSVLLFSALPATDSFTGTDGTLLTDYSANWTINVGSFHLNSNAVYPSGANHCLARWNADTFADDQYSQVVASAVGGGSYPGPAVRISTGGADTGYLAVWASGDRTYIFKHLAGVQTSLIYTSSWPSNGDVMRLEVEGTSIVLKKNGATFLGPVTDSDISSGAAGLGGLYNNSTSRVDDWTAGNLGARRRPVVVQ